MSPSSAIAALLVTFHLAAAIVPCPPVSPVGSAAESLHDHSRALPASPATAQHDGHATTQHDGHATTQHDGHAAASHGEHGATLREREHIPHAVKPDGAAVLVAACPCGCDRDVPAQETARSQLARSILAATLELDLPAPLRIVPTTPARPPTPAPSALDHIPIPA